MLDALKRFFDQRLAGAEGDGATDAVEIATAALLVEMKRADGDTPGADDDEIRRLLGAHFHLDDDAVERLLALAHERADRSVSLHDFTRLVHAHLSPPQKATVIEMLWRVAYADGRIDPHEDALVRKIADLLYVPLAAFVRAKERASGHQA